MKVFVAGATGAIGRPLVAELVRQGHAVTGMTRSNASTQGLKELGAEVALVDALDAAAVEEAVRKSGAEAVIDQLTSLPKSPADMAAARTTDRRLRIEGGGNLRRASLACGARVRRGARARSTHPGGLASLGRWPIQGVALYFCRFMNKVFNPSARVGWAKMPSWRAV